MFIVSLYYSRVVGVARETLNRGPPKYCTLDLVRRSRPSRFGGRSGVYIHVHLDVYPSDGECGYM